MSVPAADGVRECRITRRLLRRAVVLIVTLVGITMLTFAGVRMLPGEVGEGLERGRHRPESAREVEGRRELYALDRPLPEQYWNWLRRSVLLDFGRSWITRRPVSEILLEAAPRSLQVMAPSILLWYLIGVPLGAWLALRRRRLRARAATAGLFALYSLPGFFVGTLLIVLFANGEQLNWFPAGGLSGDDAPAYQGLFWLFTTEGGRQFLADRLWHLVLPVVCMTYATAAYLAEQTRASVLDSMDAPWVNTARMKGLGETAVVARHVMRNAFIPIVTVSALALPAAFTGSVFLEKIFSIEGIGWTLVQAVGERDHPVVMAVTTVAAGLTLLGLTLSDMCYAVVDPRIRFE